MYIGIPDLSVGVGGEATDVDNDGRYDVMMGSNFTISCLLNCPTATITWMQNDIVISNSMSMMTSDGFSVEYSNDSNGDITSSMLTRTAAQVNDTATYRCGTTFQTNDSVDIFVYGKCSFSFINPLPAHACSLLSY